MVKVGINGFGRMGRLAARVLLSHKQEYGLELVHINEKLGDVQMSAYLLEFDSTHGRFNQPVATSGSDKITCGSSVIKFTKEASPENIPWEDLGVEIVFDCTGSFLTEESLEGHFKRGVKRVIVSAPIDKGNILNVVMGCNEHLVTGDMKIVTAASCTTNCVAPLVGALDPVLGIELGTISTVHNVTPTQSIMDVVNPGKKNDLRRARSGAVNLAPTSTGSAKAVALIYPHLKGKLNGLAIRVPCQNSSITDFVMLAKRDTSAEEVNEILRKAAEKNPRVLGYETRALVSTDYCGDSRSSIVDALSTQVVGKRLVKVFSWYDNEWGYVNRMVELGVLVNSKMKASQETKRAHL